MTAETSLVQAVAQVGRTSVLGVTFVFALQGAGSADEVAGWPAIVLVVLGATLFHLCVYIWNDVADLAIDRTEPRRAASPLVRGTLTVRAVLGISAVATIAAAGLAAAVGRDSVVAMAGALIGLAAYDVWGKRTPVPPVLDVVQGIGWAGLAWFGATVAGGSTATTAWLAAEIAVAITLTNGVHGGLRDLANDERHGARTTARLLGARVGSDGRVHLPLRLWVYAVALHCVVITVLVVGLVRTGGADVVTLGLALVVGAGCLALLCSALAQVSGAAPSPRPWSTGFAYIVLMLLLPSVLVVDQLRGATLVVLVALFVLPWAGSRWVRGRARALTGGLRTGVRT